MTAAPLDKHVRTFRITDDGYAIRAMCDMFSIFPEKPRFCAGTFYNIIYSFTKNLI